MGLLQRLFSGKSDLDALRKAVYRQRYADALHMGEELQKCGLNAEEHAEVETLVKQAGDKLAQVNLDEGKYLLKEQQWDRAGEHLELAQQQVFSPELAQEIEQALQNLEMHRNAPLPDPAATSSTSDKCDSAAGISVSEDDLPDFDARFELILAGYPEELVPRYQNKSQEFKEAFVLGHQGEEVEALKRFGNLPAEEQDDLFDFEAGCLIARLGEGPKACNALYSALQQNPTLELATEIMVSVLIGMEEYQKAINFIQEMKAKNQNPAFCHAQLATVYYAQDDADNTLNHAMNAIEGGHADPNIVLMAAMLHEAKEQHHEAEALYRQIPAPAKGCGSAGMNLYLAEFLLRQKRELRKVLDAFNSACRHEPDNPRWQLRVAQTYLSLGWEKRGTKLLNMVLRDPNLMEELRVEGQAMLAAK
jgi:tetratricopeptide (TPR) repeat protein